MYIFFKSVRRFEISYWDMNSFQHLVWTRCTRIKQTESPLENLGNSDTCRTIFLSCSRLPLALYRVGLESYKLWWHYISVLRKASVVVIIITVIIQSAKLMLAVFLKAGCMLIKCSVFITNSLICFLVEILKSLLLFFCFFFFFYKTGRLH